ncbi:hypothetical protein K466DRAFT_88112 [Polyporus arcularius HHB13444]|uniref:Uncharacterized protein n=1 Tax=Polyporus arcularius HHB13444 TaxID=1314778 RepID=A0A5C3PPT8_9APHY|nr:hypothetical protein K466DRAFT_88112 [Polyporus arcularius HHB13444]
MSAVFGSAYTLVSSSTFCDVIQSDLARTTSIALLSYTHRNWKTCLGLASEKCSGSRRRTQFDSFHCVGELDRSCPKGTEKGRRKIICGPGLRQVVRQTRRDFPGKLPALMHITIPKPRHNVNSDPFIVHNTPGHGVPRTLITHRRSPAPTHDAEEASQCPRRHADQKLGQHATELPLVFNVQAVNGQRKLLRCVGIPRLSARTSGL